MGWNVAATAAAAQRAAAGQQGLHLAQPQHFGAMPLAAPRQPAAPLAMPPILRQPVKRCAMHAYIAHYVQYQQQLAAAAAQMATAQRAPMGGPQQAGLGGLGALLGQAAPQMQQQQQPFGGHGALPTQLTALMQQQWQAPAAGPSSAALAALAPLLQQAGGAGALASLLGAGGAGAAGGLGALLQTLMPQSQQQQQQALGGLGNNLPPQLAAALQRAGLGGTAGGGGQQPVLAGKQAYPT